MSARLCGPGDRYRLTFEALCCARGTFYTHHRAAGRVALEDGRCRVVVPDVCSLDLIPGENGITVKAIKLARPGRTLITVVVAAGPGAPEWLPPESTYLVFEGTRADQAEFAGRYIAFDGMMGGDGEPEDGSSPLDRLAVAVGRSIARANAQLSRVRQEAGTALVSGMTIRVALQQASVEQGRVLVSLARPDAGETGQFVELTMTPAPAAEAEGEEESLAAGRRGGFDLPRSGM